MLIYLTAHIFSAGLVLFTLTKRHCVPDGVNQVFILGIGTSMTLAILAFLRDRQPHLTVALTMGMLLLCFTALIALLGIGRRRHWIPSFYVLKKLFADRRIFGSKTIATPTTGGFDA